MYVANAMAYLLGSQTSQLFRRSASCPVGDICDEPPLAAFVHGTVGRIASWLACSLKGVMRCRGRKTIVRFIRRRVLVDEYLWQLTATGGVRECLQRASSLVSHPARSTLSPHCQYPLRHYWQKYGAYVANRELL